MSNEKQQVLDWINAEREGLGLEPLAAIPKGQRGSAGSCPISNSFKKRGFEAFSTRADTLILDKKDWDGDGTQIVHPYYVREFIRLFDSGRCPEFEDA